MATHDSRRPPDSSRPVPKDYAARAPFGRPGLLAGGSAHLHSRERVEHERRHRDGARPGVYACSRSDSGSGFTGNRSRGFSGSRETPGRPTSAGLRRAHLPLCRAGRKRSGSVPNDGQVSREPQPVRASAGAFLVRRPGQCFRRPARVGGRRAVRRRGPKRISPSARD